MQKKVAGLLKEPAIKQIEQLEILTNLSLNKLAKELNLTTSVFSSIKMGKYYFSTRVLYDLYSFGINYKFKYKKSVSQSENEAHLDQVIWERIEAFPTSTKVKKNLTSRNNKGDVPNWYRQEKGKEFLSLLFELGIDVNDKGALQQKLGISSSSLYQIKSGAIGISANVFEILYVNFDVVIEFYDMNAHIKADNSDIRNLVANVDVEQAQSRLLDHLSKQLDNPITEQEVEEKQEQDYLDQQVSEYFDSFSTKTEEYNKDIEISPKPYLYPDSNLSQKEAIFTTTLRSTKLAFGERYTDENFFRLLDFFNNQPILGDDY